jgi:hypothetical protein
MKKILLLLAVISSTWIVRAQSEVAGIMQDNSKKDEIISAIINDEKLSAQLLDTLMKKHYEKMLDQMAVMITDNKNKQIDVMDTMISLMETDTYARKKLTGMLLAIPPIKEEIIREYNLRWGNDIK